MPVRRGALFTLTPCRLLDTREPGQGPALSSQVARTLATVGRCGIPASAAALAVNVTVTGPSSLGHLTLHPGDQQAPVASTINFGPGQTRANSAIVPLAMDGQGTISIHPVVLNGGAVHVILDVSGYFE